MAHRPPTSRPPAHRRGNTLVLVAGILALLVIIATAYISRTQAGRVTATSVVSAEKRDDNAEIIANMIAEELVAPLFVWPVDRVAVGQGFDPKDSNTPRLLPTSVSNVGTDYDVVLVPVRYGRDPQTDASGPDGVLGTGDDEIRLLFPYNYAPFSVSPWTNWPDADITDAINGAAWPMGDGNPTALATDVFHTYRVLEGNPLGNPGFGDHRYLRDLEPVRRWEDFDNDAVLDEGELLYTHWRHLTNLSRANNAWRICTDIADVTDLNGDGVGGVITDLNIPIEQWSAVPPFWVTDSFNQISVDIGLPGTFDQDWFGSNLVPGWFQWNRATGGGYPQRYASSTGGAFAAPPNLYRLRNLDGDNAWSEPGERPEDEFRAGSLRHSVSRILTDTDGDGFTDAFWHVPPTPIERGIRQVVAVSIIDNSAMLNANVATRFHRSDYETPVQSATRGWTPADLALVGQNAPDGADGTTRWNVGMYDNPDHDSANALIKAFDYNPARWERHCGEIGMVNPGNFPLLVPNRIKRLDYWRQSGLSLLQPNAGTVYASFGLPSEIELRMYYGNNYPWMPSRFEYSTQFLYGGSTDNFFRARNREPNIESSEFQDQNTNRQLGIDKRKYMTMYSGARNETMPPWLWPFPYPPDFDDDGFLDADEREYFADATSKVDLRASIALRDWDEDGDVDDRDYRLRLADVIFRGLWQDEPTPPLMTGGVVPGGESYFGRVDENQTDDRDVVRAAAASLAANALAYRDVDHLPLLLEDAIILDEPAEDGDGIAPGFIGLEAQPFILEAFIAHVYTPFTIPDAYQDLVGIRDYEDAGGKTVLHDPNGENRETIVAVQLANPFDEPIVLVDADGNSGFIVRVFGESFDLELLYNNPDIATDGNGNIVLPPTTPEAPHTLVLYAMGDDAVIPPGPTFTEAQWLERKWLDFLDILEDDEDPADLDFTTLAKVGTWSTDREDYDEADDDDEAVEILWKARASYDPAEADFATVQATIVIDRLDPPDETDSEGTFGKAVREMPRPDEKPDPLNEGEGAEITQNNQPYPSGIKIDPDASGLWTHWTTWIRATRAWGADVDQSGSYDADERNPRYVYSDYVVIEPKQLLPLPAGATDLDPCDMTWTGPQATQAAACPPVANGKIGNRFRLVQSLAGPNEDPDGDAAANELPWFRRDYVPIGADQSAAVNEQVVRRKPAFFDMNGLLADAASGVAPPDLYPDKGWYGHPEGPDIHTIDPNGTAGDFSDDLYFCRVNALQMLVKNDDFEQIGEMLNVFIWGHELEMRLTQSEAGGPYDTVDPADPVVGTTRTFSEVMGDEPDVDADKRGGRGVRVNRLDPFYTDVPFTDDSVITGASGAPGALDWAPDPMTPDLPAAVRILDAFVCDGFGLSPEDLDDDGTVTAAEEEAQRFLNAHGYRRRMTPGLINIGTAPVEVMRSVPHWYRAVHETSRDESGAILQADGQSIFRHQRSMIPEAFVHYRDRINPRFDLAFPDRNPGHRFGPSYGERDLGFDQPIRVARGAAAIGEILLLEREGEPLTGAPPETILPEAWRADLDLPTRLLDEPPGTSEALGAGLWNGAAPYRDQQGNPQSMRLSTDVVNERGDVTGLGVVELPDRVLGDAEEANLLFAGASNVITTRSDTFTVYFKIRTFRQNPVTKVWDATDPEHVIDTSRYVMLVDRSQVEHPNDKPRILYVEKLPN